MAMYYKIGDKYYRVNQNPSDTEYTYKLAQGGEAKHRLAKLEEYSVNQIRGIAGSGYENKTPEEIYRIGTVQDFIRDYGKNTTVSKSDEYSKRLGRTVYTLGDSGVIVPSDFDLSKFIQGQQTVAESKELQDHMSTPVVDRLTGKTISAPGGGTQQPYTSGQTLGSLGQTSQKYTSIYRDLNNNLYGVDAQGNKTKLTEAEAFAGGLGINEKFVPPGQTVSLQMATTGNEGISDTTEGAAGDTTGGASGTGTYSTGVPELDALLERLDKFLEDNITAGNTINPNIELEPSVVQQFLDQAETEIEPYYSSQIKLAKEDLVSSLDYLSKTYALGKQEQEEKFRQTLASSREGRSGVGTIFSGARGKEEQGLAASETRNLESSALAAENAARGAYSQAERTIGSRNLAGITSPSLSSYAASTEGLGRYSPSRTLSFTGTGDVTGSMEREQMTAIQARKNELEEAERRRRSLNFYSSA